MKKITKSAQRIAELEQIMDATSLALADLANGNVKWFTRFNYALGISRPNGAAGGIVIEKVVGGIVSAYYWEPWSAQELNNIASVITGEDTPYNSELLRRRSCIEEAKAYVSAEQANR